MQDISEQYEHCWPALSYHSIVCSTFSGRLSYI